MISASSAELAFASKDAGAPKREKSAPGVFQRGARYAGHYWCPRGRTELTLVFENVDGDDIGVIFEFNYPGGASSRSATGSFRMRGAFDRSTRSLRLKGERWIEQPEGEEMMNLVGKLGDSGSISGTISREGCSTFFVHGPGRSVLGDDDEEE